MEKKQGFLPACRHPQVFLIIQTRITAAASGMKLMKWESSVIVTARFKGLRAQLGAAGLSHPARR